MVGAPANDATTDEIRAAREALGAPLGDLAAATLAVAAELEAVRHDLPRGGAMAAGVREARSDLPSLRARAEQATAAAAAVTGADAPRVRGATRALRSAARRARLAVDAAERELAFLERVAELDTRMDDALEVFDSRGAQSERRAALAAHAQALADLAAKSAAVEPVPAACPALRDHRIRWAALLRERARNLAALANSDSGALYDAFRDAFEQQPYGEDRLAADAGDRPCWQRASVVARAGVRVREDVARIEALLNP